MSSASEEREEQSLKCFVCNIKVTTCSSYNIYCTFMPQRELLLIDVMSKILKKVLNPSLMRSSVLCRRCFTLFDELDQISTRFNKLQTDIIKRYTSTCIEYKDATDFNVVDSMVQTKVEELSQSEQENGDTSFNDADQNATDFNVVGSMIQTKVEELSQSEQENGDTSFNDDDKNATDFNVVGSMIQTKVEELSQSEQENGDTSFNDDDKNATDFNVVGSMVQTKVEKLSQCEQENDDISFNDDDENSEKSHVALNEIVENIINSIQADETMDCDDNSKDCTSDTAEDEILLIDKNITEHMDIIPLTIVEEPICETKSRKHSVASVGVNYKCENCDVSFERASDLKNHLTTVHRSPKHFFCSSCDKSYSTKQALNSHLSNDHKTLDIGSINEQVDSISPTIKTENETSQCDTDSIIVTEANADYLNHSPEGLIIDVKPDFSIDNSMYLEEVIQEEIENDDFEWKEDQQMNYIEENIIEDSSSTIDEAKAPSSGSEKSDNRLKKGRNKRGTSRSGERACLPAIHSCVLCDKKWRTVTELKSHIQSHSALRPYVCEICGQAYKMKKALDVHIGMHNGIHPFTCEYCNKSFTQKVGLQKHIPIHTGYTRFQCDLCGKRFIHQKSFHIHTMTHTGEKHVKCSECGLAVLSQSHLKRHLRVHTGERPYACPICGKRFAEKYNMNAHVHIHQNNGGLGPKRNRNHICQLCGMSYDRKHKLEYHLSSAHNKIETKLSQDQELVQQQQTKIEYFHENSQGHQIINVDNNAIDHNSGTTTITVNGVKFPVSIDDTPTMVATMSPPPHTTNLVPHNIPAASSLLTYSPSNTNNNNNQQLADSSQNAYMSQNPVTIQLS